MPRERNNLLGSYWFELPDDNLYLEFDVHGVYTAGTSPVTYGPPEQCDPGSPSELEVERVSLTKLVVGGADLNLETEDPALIKETERRVMEEFDKEPSTLYEEYLDYLDNQEPTYDYGDDC